MRIVNFCIPYPCGLYQVHLALQRYFQSRRSTLVWLGSGAENTRKVCLHATEQDREGSVVAPGTEDGAARTRALVEYIRETRPDALIFNVWGDAIDTNAAQYMPREIPRVVILHNNTLAAYRAAFAIRNHTDFAIAISRRIAEDLNRSYGYNRERIRYIPNGIDLTRYAPREPLEQARAAPLRILSHGRVDASSKGILHLPAILSKLADANGDWEFTLSGDGPDLPELKQRFARAGLLQRMQFRGWTPPADVPALMQAHDVLLFPSVFEGFPLTLIEAMASGCVPVASKLAGITDDIVEHGESGLLFPVGDTKRAAGYLLELLADRERLARLRAGALAAAPQYSFEEQGTQYESLFDELSSQARRSISEEPLDRWHLDRGLKPAWWYGLPEPVKNRLRVARERLRAFVNVP